MLDGCLHRTADDCRVCSPIAHIQRGSADGNRHEPLIRRRMAAFLGALGGVQLRGGGGLARLADIWRRHWPDFPAAGAVWRFTRRPGTKRCGFVFTGRGFGENFFKRGARARLIIGGPANLKGLLAAADLVCWNLFRPARRGCLRSAAIILLDASISLLGSRARVRTIVRGGVSNAKQPEAQNNSES